MCVFSLQLTDVRRCNVLAVLATCVVCTFWSGLHLVCDPCDDVFTFGNRVGTRNESA